LPNKTGIQGCQKSWNKSWGWWWWWWGGPGPGWGWGWGCRLVGGHVQGMGSPTSLLWFLTKSFWTTFRSEKHPQFWRNPVEEIQSQYLTWTSFKKLRILSQWAALTQICHKKISFQNQSVSYNCFSKKSNLKVSAYSNKFPCIKFLWEATQSKNKLFSDNWYWTENDGFSLIRLICKRWRWHEFICTVHVKTNWIGKRLSFCPFVLMSFLPFFPLSFCHIVLFVLLSFCPFVLLSFLSFLSFCPFVLMSSCPHVLMSSCPHVLMSFCPFVLLSFCPFVLLSFCPFVLLSFCPFVLMSFCPSVLLSFCPSVLLSFCPSFLLSFCLSIPVSFCPKKF